MSIRHLIRQTLAFLLLMFTLPCLAQQSYQTTASIKHSNTADTQACKGRMNCFNTEMRKSAAIRNADRKAKAQMQAKNKGNAAVPQGEVKQ